MQLADSYEGIWQQARQLYSLGDVEGTITQLRRLIERLSRLSDRVLSRRPDLRDLHIQAIMELGMLFEGAGRTAESIELKRALPELDPANRRDWLFHLAELHIYKGEVDDGLADLRALAEAEPDDAAGWDILATYLRLTGRLGAAEAMLSRALAAPDKRPGILGSIHLNRSRVYGLLGRVNEAVAAWKAAVVHDPALVSSVDELITLLLQAGRLDQALVYVERDPDRLRQGLQRGIILARQGRTDEAHAVWQQVRDTWPLDQGANRAAWLEATLRLRDVETAAERLDSLLEAPTIRLGFLAGITFALQGKLGHAHGALRSVIAALSNSYPPAYKFGSDDWRLLNQLVDDPESKAQLKPYFAVVDTALDTLFAAAREQPHPEETRTPGGVLLPGR